MNSVNLIGRLTANPELKYFESGKVIARFSLAVNRTKDESDFFEVEAWEKTAEVIGQYCTKGSQVGVSGSLLQEKWKDKTTGGNRSKVVVRCQRVELLGSKQQEQASNGATTPSQSYTPAPSQTNPPPVAQVGADPAVDYNDIPF